MNLKECLELDACFIGSANDCSSAPIILSEINLGLFRSGTGLRGQYIELYDGGRGGTSLTDYLLLLYSEDDVKAYNKVVMNGYRTNR